MEVPRRFGIGGFCTAEYAQKAKGRLSPLPEYGGAPFRRIVQIWE
jgi:hypothetical protein